MISRSVRYLLCTTVHETHTIALRKTRWPTKSQVVGDWLMASVAIICLIVCVCGRDSDNFRCYSTKKITKFRFVDDRTAHRNIHFTDPFTFRFAIYKCGDMPYLQQFNCKHKTEMVQFTKNRRSSHSPNKGRKKKHQKNHAFRWSTIDDLSSAQIHWTIGRRQ